MLINFQKQNMKDEKYGENQFGFVLLTFQNASYYWNYHNWAIWGMEV